MSGLKLGLYYEVTADLSQSGVPSNAKHKKPTPLILHVDTNDRNLKWFQRDNRKTHDPLWTMSFDTVANVDAVPGDALNAFDIKFKATSVNSKSFEVRHVILGLPHTQRADRDVLRYLIVALVKNATSPGLGEYYLQRFFLRYPTGFDAKTFLCSDDKGKERFSLVFSPFSAIVYGQSHIPIRALPYGAYSFSFQDKDKEKRGMMKFKADPESLGNNRDIIKLQAKEWGNSKDGFHVVMNTPQDAQDSLQLLDQLKPHLVSIKFPTSDFTTWLANEMHEFNAQAALQKKLVVNNNSNSNSSASRQTITLSNSGVSRTLTRRQSIGLAQAEGLSVIASPSVTTQQSRARSIVTSVNIMDSVLPPPPPMDEDAPPPPPPDMMSSPTQQEVQPSIKSSMLRPTGTPIIPSYSLPAQTPFVTPTVLQQSASMKPNQTTTTSTPPPPDPDEDYDMPPPPPGAIPPDGATAAAFTPPPPPPMDLDDDLPPPPGGSLPSSQSAPIQYNYTPMEIVSPQPSLTKLEEASDDELVGPTDNSLGIPLPPIPLNDEIPVQQLSKHTRLEPRVSHYQQQQQLNNSNNDSLNNFSVETATPPTLGNPPQRRSSAHKLTVNKTPCPRGCRYVYNNVTPMIRKCRLMMMSESKHEDEDTCLGQLDMNFTFPFRSLYNQTVYGVLPDASCDLPDNYLITSSGLIVECRINGYVTVEDSEITTIIADTPLFILGRKIASPQQRITFIAQGCIPGNEHEMEMYLPPDQNNDEIPPAPTAAPVSAGPTTLSINPELPYNQTSLSTTLSPTNASLETPLGNMPRFEFGLQQGTQITVQLEGEDEPVGIVEIPAGQDAATFTFANLRALMDEELDCPCEEYVFLFNGIKVGPKQEPKKVVASLPEPVVIIRDVLKYETAKKEEEERKRLEEERKRVEEERKKKEAEDAARKQAAPNRAAPAPPGRSAPFKPTAPQTANSPTLIAPERPNLQAPPRPNPFGGSLAAQLASGGAALKKVDPVDKQPERKKPNDLLSQIKGFQNRDGLKKVDHDAIAAEKAKYKARPSVAGGGMFISLKSAMDARRKVVVDEPIVDESDDDDDDWGH